MSTIVMNTLTGAVTEWDWAFSSLNDTHAGDGAGLYALGGDTDAGAPIVAEVLTGETLWADQHRKGVEMVWLSIDGEGTAELIVKARVAGEFRYPFPVRPTGQSRARPGKGLRENYLAFGFSNPGGEDFSIDRIEVMETASGNRRVG